MLGNNFKSQRRWHSLRLALFGLLLHGVQASPLVEYDWGPIASKWMDVHTNLHTRALGPVFETIDNPDGARFGAVRPLFCTWDTGGERDAHYSEYLWPLAQTKLVGSERSTRVLLGFYRNWDIHDPESRERLWILPLYFQGRAADGEEYVALFPLGGTIRHFLNWDRVSFTLFPLHVKSSVRDVEASTWLWPIFSKTKGEHVERFRVFPFYGWSKFRDEWKKRFICWPIWTDVTYDHPKSRGKGWILFPVTGHMKLSDQESWWFLPPLFRYTLGKHEDRLYGPWPFLQRSAGAVDKFYIWPLFGSKSQGNVERKFLLWPLGGSSSSKQKDRWTNRMHLIPLFWWFEHRTPPGYDGKSEVTETYFKLWPLASRHRDGAHSRVRALDLNPTRAAPVERNWAPFWQIFRRDRVGENVDTEVLWGTYRSIVRENGNEYRSLFPLVDWSKGEQGGFNILKGLIGRERGPEGDRWRVLYFFKFGGKKGDDANL